MSPSRNQERDFLNLPTIIDRMFFNSITEFDSYNTFGRGPERTRYRTNAISSWEGLERKKTFSGARISSMQNKHWIFMALLVRWLYDSPPVCNSKIFDERRIMPGQIYLKMFLLIALTPTNFAFMMHTRQTSINLFVYQGVLFCYYTQKRC